MAKTYLLDERTFVSGSKSVLENSLNLKTYVEQVADQNVHVPSAVSEINVTATATPAQVASRYITSTSAAAVTITLPSAASIWKVVGGGEVGSTLDFVVDNSAGANTVTVAVGSGIVVATSAITGGAVLTVSTANKVGTFRLLKVASGNTKLIRLA